MYLEQREINWGASGQEFPKVSYVSGGCGSGKTHAICQEIRARPERNWLYVAPTINLLKQTGAMLNDLGVSSSTITSESASHDTKRRISEHLFDAEEEGDVLLITWNAYSGMRFFPNRSNYLILIDEIPQLDTFHPLVLPRHNYRLSDELDVSPIAGTGLGRVTLRNESVTRRWIDGPRDDLDEPLRPLFNDLLAGFRDVFVDLASWERICDRGERGRTDERNTIYFLVLYNVTLFDRAILIGANIKDSMLVAWLQE